MSPDRTAAAYPAVPPSLGEGPGGRAEGARGRLAEGSSVTWPIPGAGATPASEEAACGSPSPPPRGSPATWPTAPRPIAPRTERTRPSLVAKGASRVTWVLPPSVRGQESVQGGASREPPAVRDLRGRRRGAPGRGAPPLRGLGVVVRCAPVSRVPDPPCRPGLRGVVVAGLAGVRLRHPAPVTGARGAPAAAEDGSRGAGAPRLLLLAAPARRGRGGVRPWGATSGRHRAPAAAGRAR